MMTALNTSNISAIIADKLQSDKTVDSRNNYCDDDCQQC